MALLVGPPSLEARGTPVWDYEVVAQYPHDPKAYTQGLLYDDGFLYESTGRYGRSEVRRVELTTGRVLSTRRLSKALFGEGLAKVGHRLLQLTWRERRCLVYHLNGLKLVDRFDYVGEGWGLTYDGSRLLMSDGSHVIRMRDPSGFEEVGRIVVEEDGRPVTSLNELELIDGMVWANVYPSTRIAVIEPRRGRVVAWLDMSDLAARQRGPIDALNGIAHDPDTGRIFVTGKLWPALYEIRIRAPSP